MKINIKVPQSPVINKNYYTISGNKINSQHIEQWLSFIDDTYIYYIYGKDNNWKAVRYDRKTLEWKTTWLMDWNRPTTLLEVQTLDYLYDYN